MIQKEQIESKLAALKQNKLVVEDRIKTASETIKQANEQATKQTNQTEPNRTSKQSTKQTKTTNQTTKK